MRLTPIKYNVQNYSKNSLNELNFGHGNESFWKSDYSKKDKFIVAGTTALGVTGSLLALSKYRGYKLNPRSFWKYF